MNRSSRDGQLLLLLEGRRTAGLMAGLMGSESMRRPDVLRCNEGRRILWSNEEDRRNKGLGLESSSSSPSDSASLYLDCSS